MRRGGREWRGWQGWWGVIRGNAHYRHSSLKRMKRMIDGNIRRGLRESKKLCRWETWRDGGEQVQRFLFCFFFWDPLVQHRAFTVAQHHTWRICPSAWAKHSENFPAYIQSKLCFVLPFFCFSWWWFIKTGKLRVERSFQNIFEKQLRSRVSI